MPDFPAPKVALCREKRHLKQHLSNIRLARLGQIGSKYRTHRRAECRVRPRAWPVNVDAFRRCTSGNPPDNLPANRPPLLFSREGKGPTQKSTFDSAPDTRSDRLNNREIAGLRIQSESKRESPTRLGSRGGTRSSIQWFPTPVGRNRTSPWSPC